MAKSKKLSDFRQQAMNANKHTERGMKALEASMNEVGYTAPMIAAADGEIIVGSARHETAANVFGADVEPVIVESDGKRPVIVVRTDIKNAETREAKRIGLLDNRVQQIDLDFDAEVLAQLYAEDKTLTAGLWSDDELTELLNEAVGVAAGDADAEPQIDKAAELNKIWQVKAGDLWQIGEHRLLCGDSTKREDVERVMMGERANIVHADPPYGMSLDTNFDAMFAADKRHRKTGERFDAVIGDDGSFDISSCMALCRDVKEQFWWGADYYRTILPSGGGWYVWDKRWNDSGMNLDAVAGNCFELCWSSVPHKRIIFRITWSGHHGMQSEDTKSRIYPNQKPVRLISDLLKPISGGIAYDPCCGSGTTIMACEQLGRKCRAIEISPEYVSVALERWHQATKRMPELVEGK